MKSLLLAATFVHLIALPAAAEVVIDQEFVAPTNINYFFDYPGDYMAQTFTLRNSGRITSVGLQVSRQGVTTSPLRFQLTRTDAAGDPLVTDALASLDLSSSLVNVGNSGLPMLNIDLSSHNIQVQAGDVLALVLSSNYIHYHWNETIFQDRIAGGKFSVYSPQTFGARWFHEWLISDRTRTGDAGYRITIDAVPEPSTVLLVALALLAAVRTRARGCQSGE